MFETFGAIASLLAVGGVLWVYFGHRQEVLNRFDRLPSESEFTILTDRIAALEQQIEALAVSSSMARGDTPAVWPGMCLDLADRPTLHAVGVQRGSLLCNGKTPLAEISRLDVYSAQSCYIDISVLQSGETTTLHTRDDIEPVAGLDGLFVALRSCDSGAGVISLFFR